MCAEEGFSVQNKKYKLVPPDGGWGYIIWVAVIINYATSTAFVACFGMIFNNFMIEIDMGSTSVTLLNGITAMCVAFSAFFAGLLLKVMSARQVALLASFIFNLGNIGTVFAKTKFMFFLFQGLILGCGFGMLYNVTCTTINDYFLKKRLLTISFTQTVSAAVGMVAPMFIKWTLEEYGYCSTLIIISGVCVHTFIASMLMQPVSWHMKKVEVTDDKSVEEEMKILLVDKKDENNKSNAIPIVKLTDTECVSKSSIDQKVLPEIHLPVESKKGIKILRFTKFIAPTCTGSDPIAVLRAITHMIDKALGISDMKSFLISSVALGMPICIFVESSYIILLPQALYSIGLNEDKVALVLSLTAFGDLTTRILFIILNKWLNKIGSHELYVAGLVIALVTRLGMLWSKNITVMMVFATIMGASRCTITVLPPLVISDTVEPEKFAPAMGIFMCLFGLISIIFGPLLGAVRDLTNSYATVFYVYLSCLAIVIMFWVIELCYKRNKHKRKQQRDNSKKSRSANKRDRRRYSVVFNIHTLLFWTLTIWAGTPF